LNYTVMCLEICIDTASVYSYNNPCKLIIGGPEIGSPLRFDGWMQKPGFGGGLKAEKMPRTTSTSG